MIILGTVARRMLACLLYIRALTQMSSLLSCSFLSKLAAADGFPGELLWCVGVFPRLSMRLERLAGDGIGFFYEEKCSL